MSPNIVLTPYYVWKHSPHFIFCLKKQSSLHFMSQNIVLTTCYISEHSPHSMMSQNIAFTPFCGTVTRQHSLHVQTASNHRVSQFLILNKSDLHGTAYNTLPDDTQENRIKHCINYLLNVLCRDTCSTDSLVTIKDRNLREVLMS